MSHDTSKSMHTHPVAALFPMLAPDSKAFLDLVSDIKANGQIDPIVMCGENIILDGRNRLAACRAAGIEPRLVDFDKWAKANKYEGTEAAFAYAKNFARRDLTDDQRVAIAASYQQYCDVAQKARDKKRAGGKKAGRGRPAQKDVATSPQPKTKRAPTTRQTLAKEAGVSEHKAKQALDVQRDAPDLLQQVAEGTLPLAEADKRAKADVVPKEPKAKASDMKFVSVKDLADDYRQRIARDILTLDAKDRCEFLKRVNAILNQFVGELRDQALMPLDEGTKAVAGIFAAAMDPSNAGELERSTIAAANKEAGDDRLH